MSNIYQFHKKMTEEEIMELPDEEFDSLLVSYESHPKLKNLITEYRKESEKTLSAFLQTGLKGRNTSKSSEGLYQETAENFLSGVRIGQLKMQIAEMISSL